MGPQHPATHGVLRLLLTIDGEIIKKVEPDLGYIHRSIEKMCERDSYQQIVHLTDRMDYLSSHIKSPCARVWPRLVPPQGPLGQRLR